jgi:putative ABC transport system permease protein
VVTGVLPRTGLSMDQLILTPLSSVWAIHETATRYVEGDEHEHDHKKAGEEGVISHEEGNGIQREQDETDDYEGHGTKEQKETGDHERNGREAHPDDAGHKAPDDGQPSSTNEPLRAAAQAGVPFMAMQPAPAKPDRQITAVLIKFKSPLAQLQLPRMINENTRMQAAVPAIEVNRLHSLLGAGTEILRILGWLLAGLAACSIFVMLVQGTHERRYELALMRSMGGGRIKLLGLVLSEAAMLALAGIAGGFLLSRAALFLLQQEIFAHYHLNLSNAWEISGAELYTAAAILAACLLAALFPAVRAFRLNISKTLANA